MSVVEERNESKTKYRGCRPRSAATCRQVYNEAHFIQYSTNTFSCADPETLQDFVLSIAQGTKSNHLAIRSLFLEMVYDKPDHRNQWEKAVSTCVRKLEALQKVSISIDLRDWYNLPSSVYGDLTSDGKRCRDDLVSAIRGLKRLPLKTATIVISDNGAFQRYLRYGVTRGSIRQRFSLDEKRKWVRYLREYILQPNRWRSSRNSSMTTLPKGLFDQANLLPHRQFSSPVSPAVGYGSALTTEPSTLSPSRIVIPFRWSKRPWLEIVKRINTLMAVKTWTRRGPIAKAQDSKALQEK